MNTVQAYLAGLNAIASWDGQVVSNDLAQQRCQTCLGCPLNRPGNVLVEAVAKAVKIRMEAKICRLLHVDGIEKLRTCSACECHLPAKIWYPLQQIYPVEAVKSRLDMGCWLLSEGLTGD